ncbi:quinolinate synthase NadA, partial [Candidatus Avelusimicrobium alvi]|uniref:quinolinate synthase NadA n=1 Tax=Candidatus Avelusimicrobium alvi TaxID=3416221 RepID=UPI003D1223F1
NRTIRTLQSGICVLAHPECPIEVCELCDYVGSTKGMASYVATSDAKTFGMLTEFGLVNRLEAEHPDKTFVWPFGVCSYMKRNSLINTLEALIDPRPDQVVEVDPAVAQAAKKSIDKMFELAK